MKNERYCNEIQIQILNCIRESPKSAREIREKLGISENISTHTRKLKRLNLIFKTRTDKEYCLVWRARI